MKELSPFIIVGESVLLLFLLFVVCERSKLPYFSQSPVSKLIVHSRASVGPICNSAIIILHDNNVLY